MVGTAARKILIVDSDVLSVIHAERVLRAAGYEVCRLLSGAGLFAKLEYEQPDVALVDIATSGLQPDVFFDRLRQQASADLVLVLFSAKSPEELQQMCLANDSINGYFSKSMDMERLPEFIESFFVG